MDGHGEERKEREEREREGARVLVSRRTEGSWSPWYQFGWMMWFCCPLHTVLVSGIAYCTVPCTLPDIAWARNWLDTTISARREGTCATYRYEPIAAWPACPAGVASIPKYSYLAVPLHATNLGPQRPSRLIFPLGTGEIG